MSEVPSPGRWKQTWSWVEHITTAHGLWAIGTGGAVSTVLGFVTELPWQAYTGVGSLACLGTATMLHRRERASTAPVTTPQPSEAAPPAPSPPQALPDTKKPTLQEELQRLIDSGLVPDPRFEAVARQYGVIGAAALAGKKLGAPRGPLGNDVEIFAREIDMGAGGEILAPQGSVRIVSDKFNQGGHVKAGQSERTPEVRYSSDAALAEHLRDLLVTGQEMFEAAHLSVGMEGWRPLIEPEVESWRLDVDYALASRPRMQASFRADPPLRIDPRFTSMELRDLDYKLAKLERIIEGLEE